MLFAYFDDTLIEAGCDEAGRGCLSGPVFAAAAILPKNYENGLLNDSKKLNEKQRYLLRESIEKDAISWAIAMVSPEEIDRINILKASFLAMHRALDTLSIRPESLLIDGNRFTPYKGISHHCIIKGDGKFMSIAAASILAKTYRDDYMLEIHKSFPYFAWNENKGYPTIKHRNAIAEYGACEYHRKSFRLLPSMDKKTQYDE